MPAEAQVKQEARRVLRKLAAPRQGLFAAGGRFVLGRNASARAAVTAEMVHAFVQAGWIAPDGPGRYVIAEAGRAFLAREAHGFAAQHGERVQAPLPGEERLVTVHLGESPLARLKSRGLVDAAQFAAGEKLRRDFTLGQMTPRMGVDLSRPVVCGGAAATLSAMSRWRRASASTRRWRRWGRACRTCCSMSAAISARWRRWKRRAAGPGARAGWC